MRCHQGNPDQNPYRECLDVRFESDNAINNQNQIISVTPIKLNVFVNMERFVIWEYKSLKFGEKDV